MQNMNNYGWKREWMKCLKRIPNSFFEAIPSAMLVEIHRRFELNWKKNQTRELIKNLKSEKTNE